MPNLSFDIFFNEDTVNVTATRGKAAPKIKPDWKVRSAPKLPPKTPSLPATAAFANPSKVRAAVDQAQAPQEEASNQAKRAAPKIQQRN